MGAEEGVVVPPSPPHCLWLLSQVFIQKSAPTAKILVNGDPLGDARRELHHNIRILFGSSTLYCFCHPTERDAGIKAGLKWPTPTYEEAQAEIAQCSGLTTQMKGGGSQVRTCVGADLLGT